jgi:hypothetical protein
MIRVELPTHLQSLAQIDGGVKADVASAEPLLLIGALAGG